MSAGSGVPLAQEVGVEHAEQDDDEELRAHRVAGIWVEDGDDDEPDGVVDDGEEQQVVDGRMGRAKDEARHHPSDRNVRRRHDAPAVEDCGLGDCRREGARSVGNREKNREDANRS